MANSFTTSDLVTALKAAAEPTRLRILLLLAGSELTVKDLTQILGQSQPRISRHLKLLLEAGLVERYREGSWAYFHVADSSEGGRLAHRILEEVAGADPVLVRDRERGEALRREREAAAQAYFVAHADDWDRIRSLHVPEGEVETAMAKVLGAGPFDLLVDLGTGTGRILEAFHHCYARGVGIDVNQSMLGLARANLARNKLAKAQVRHGDLYNLTLPDRCADAVVMHQVLHFLSEPAAAIAEAGRILAPGGRLLIVDFAPHGMEFLREQHAHERLGFSPSQVRQWIGEAGLEAGTTMELSPGTGAGPDKLTVLLWLATRTQGTARTHEGPKAREFEEAR